MQNVAFESGRALAKLSKILVVLDGERKRGTDGLVCTRYRHGWERKRNALSLFCLRLGCEPTGICDDPA